MTLQEFNALSLNSQAEVVWSEGEHVTNRWDEGCYLILYLLPRFYVAAYYDDERDEIQKFQAFSSTEPRQHYIENVNLLPLP